MVLKRFLYAEVYEGDRSSVLTEGKTLILLNAKTQSNFEENESFTTGVKVQGHLSVEQRKELSLRKNKLAKLLENKQWSPAF